MVLTEIDETSINKFAREFFDINSHIEPLSSYAGRNFCLTEQITGKKYIFKISEPDENYNNLAAQNAMMHHLHRKKLPLSIPSPVRAKNQEEIIPVPGPQENLYMRLLTFLPGNFLCDLKKHSNQLLTQWGSSMAKIDLALMDFNHSGFKHDHIWDFENIPEQMHKFQFCKQAQIRKIIQYYFLEYINHVQPKLRHFKKSVIHNDGNDYNLLIRTGDSDHKISGLIDFGDSIYSYHICELAIACTYAMLEKSDPLTAMINVVKGYHEHLSLSEAELELLPTLIGARLALSISFSSYEFEQNPQNEYLLVSQKGAKNLINQLIRMNPNMIAQKLCEHCKISSGTSYKLDSQYNEIRHQRKKLLGPNLSLSYQNPIYVDRGAFQYLYSHDGQTFLDCVNNIAHVGHCHPHINQVATQQMLKLNTNTRYLHPEIIDLADKLIALFPEPLDTCYFVCSGSEANELAIRLAKTYTGRQRFIVLEGAYHGNTNALIDLSPYKNKGAGGSGCPDWVYEAPLPYANQLQKSKDLDHCTQTKESINFIERLCINSNTNQHLAGFICESFPGCAGQIELPRAYLHSVYDLVRRCGGVCIADEIQVGFGRTGKFWGFESSQVVPDIITLGKPMGNGHPIAAVVTSRSIAQAFDNGMEYFNSFGGNPVSCAIANSVLSIINSEGLREHALHTGQTLKNALQTLATKTSIIEEVRGQGLFLGVELKNKIAGKNVEKFHVQIVESMKSRGFLLSLDGIGQNVIKIKPPLCINYDDLEELYQNFKEVIKEIENIL